MDLKRLPSELIQEILDQVPFLEWLTSLTLVCKEWLKLCLTSRSQNKSLIIDDKKINLTSSIKLSAIRDIAARYQVTGLDVSNFIIESADNTCPTDVSWLDIIAASKRLKWLALNSTHAISEVDTTIFDSVERLSIEDCGYPFTRRKLSVAVVVEKFPKVRTFSVVNNFMLPNVPPNTEVVHTNFYYDPEYTFSFLDNIARKNTRLKKILLTLSNESIEYNPYELKYRYERLESHMQTKHNIQLIVRDPFVFLTHLDLFIEAYHKNVLPYDYYIIPTIGESGKIHVTLFSHACTIEALDVMKYLIDSGITSLEKELRDYPLPLEGHERMFYKYYSKEYYPFLLNPQKFVDLTDKRKEIIDYFMSLGLTCATKGKNGESIFHAFGMTHLVVKYLTSRSPPQAIALSIHSLMTKQSQFYQTYFKLYDESSKEAQEMTRQLLKDFDFSNVLYYVIESRDLQIIDKFLEEFGVDLTGYTDAINECPSLEECDDIRLYINSHLNH